ncbi:Murein DD-endopeptidase MepS/Murein LD-carboxypeptidase precursor [compost metagenome]
MFNLLITLITFAKRVKLEALKRKDKAINSYTQTRDNMLKEKGKGVGDGDVEKTKKEIVKERLTIFILSSLSAIVTFFESLPIFLAVIFSLLILLCIIVVIIIVFSMLSLITDLIKDIPNFSVDPQAGYENAIGGKLAWTDEELATRGIALTEYEKNLYRMGILAKKAVEGYNGVKLMETQGATTRTKLLFIMGVGSTETGMRFYSNGDKDITKYPSDIPTNELGYGFMGINSSKTLEGYYSGDPQGAANLKQQYQPASTPAYPATFAPYGIAMTAQHMNSDVQNYGNSGRIRGVVNKILDAWGIQNNRDEVAAILTFSAAQAQYHGATLDEYEGYLTFVAAVYALTSDNDAERSFEKITIVGNTYDESSIRPSMIGTSNHRALNGYGSPSNMNNSTGNTKIAINGEQLSVPLWKKVWEKFGSRPDVQASWNLCRQVAGYNGYGADRVLNFHYGLNSYLQALKIENDLSKKLIGDSLVDGGTGNSQVDKLLENAYKIYGANYIWSGTTINIIKPGKVTPVMENGKVKEYTGEKGQFTGGLDCSAFTQWSYKQIGVNLTRTTWTQVKEGKPVDIKNVQPGDLIFFDTSGPGSNSHVGLYIGNGWFIHEANSNKGCILSRVDEGYYSGVIHAVRRML